MARDARSARSRRARGEAASAANSGSADGTDTPPEAAEQPATASSSREASDADDGRAAAKRAPARARGGRAARLLDLALWAAGAGATFALQNWLRQQEERRLEAEELKVRAEWAHAAGDRFDLLLTSRAADDAAHPDALWGPPQSAAWLDVLLNGLWADMLSGVLQRAAPAYLQEVLAVYLEARDVVPIPEFITAMRVVSLDVGKRCPFGIRAVRVAKPRGAPGEDLVLDLDVEVLSSDAEIVIHALVNDLVAPLLAKLGLRKEDSSYIALAVTDVRLSGTLRMRLAPSARLAFAAFREPPAVALGMSVAYHSKLGFEKRVPITALPGVVPMMELLVRTEVAEYAVWPRFFAVDLAPPLLLALPCAPRRGPLGRLRITLRGVRGAGEAARAAAEAEAAKAAAKAEAAGKEAAHAARAVTPFAVFRWSTGLHSHRTRCAAAPLDAAGCASWAAATSASEAEEHGGGETFEGDTFSPFGLEFLSLELRAPGFGRLGAAQVKLEALATGETLFSFAGAASDAFTPLPSIIIGEERAAYEARTAACLTGRTDAPGVECSGERNAMDAWVPLDGQPGAAAHLRIEVDWMREEAPATGGRAAPAAGAGGLNAAVASARGAAVVREHTLHVAVVAARGLPGKGRDGTWAVAVGRPGDWRGAARTRPASGVAPEWDDAFELKSTSEAPVVTLLQLRGPLQPGAPVTPRAAATLPATQLSTGDAAAMWLKLEPLPGFAAAPGVEVLLRCSLSGRL